MKNWLIGGGILAAGYAAAGVVFAKQQQEAVDLIAGGPVGPLSVAAAWPLWMYRTRKSAMVGATGAILARANKTAMEGTMAGRKLRSI